MQIAKGIVHTHTTFSYDGKLSVAEFCELLKNEGFHFVGLTEHTLGLGPEKYAELVRECREHSDSKFIAIPGLEFRCGDGNEIAGIGVQHWLEDKPAEEMIPAIREAGGFSIWVHPFKRPRWSGPFLDCDAIEILNGKLDGVLAPNLGLLQAYKRERARGKIFGAIFGLDFHNLRQLRSVWVECQVEELTTEEILKALREGRYVSRIAYGAMTCEGKIKTFDYLKMISLRTAFLTWRTVLQSVPGSAKSILVATSRPLVRMLKRRG
ncbi:MAG: hypothetical protein JWO91_3888 [Acidobacteriaceae bacterium]|nr:hypothetical protein [Acidobacteriaceae bacterium]